MFDLFKSSRNKSTGTPDSQYGDSTTDSGPSTTAPQRELIRVVLRDTLRLNGIPLDWIGCDVLSRTQPGRRFSLQIQLRLNTWNEDLLRYAPVLQQQLVQNLQRFDPATDHSSHQVVWSFAPGCGCPYTAMPAPTRWTLQPAAIEKQKFQLPRSPRDYRTDEDFATTVPSLLP